MSDASRTVTWRELDARTDRVARGLLAAGVKHGDLVTLGLPNTVDFIEACYGLWKIGATPQPISYRLPAAEAEAVMELADTPILIAGPSIESARRRFDIDDLLAMASARRSAGGHRGAGLEGADVRRFDRPAQADPVGRRGALHAGRASAAGARPAKT